MWSRSNKNAAFLELHPGQQLPQQQPLDAPADPTCTITNPCWSRPSFLSWKALSVALFSCFNNEMLPSSDKTTAVAKTELIAPLAATENNHSQYSQPTPCDYRKLTPKQVGRRVKTSPPSRKASSAVLLYLIQKCGPVLKEQPPCCGSHCNWRVQLHPAHGYHLVLLKSQHAVWHKWWGLELLEGASFLSNIK